MKRQPCNNCPFRTDKPFRALLPQKVESIHYGLMRDSSFACHKTTIDGGNGERYEGKDSTQCVGAAIYLENVRPGGMLANLGFRMAAAFNASDPLSTNPADLDLNASVAGSYAELMECAASYVSSDE